MRKFYDFFKIFIIRYRLDFFKTFVRNIDDVMTNVSNNKEKEKKKN